MPAISVEHQVPNYYSRIDRLLSLAQWVGLAAALDLPFMVPMPIHLVYLFYALIALDAVVGLWAYSLGGYPLGRKKYYVTILANQIVSLAQLIILGPSGVY